jgi:hypothetical protein
MTLTQDDLSSVILSTIASSSSIPDTRYLRCKGATLSSQDDQTAIKAVLDSLASKEVNGFLAYLISDGGGATDHHDIICVDRRRQ